MKKIIFIILLFPLFSSAQDTTRYVGKGLFCGKGTLAAGRMTNYPVTNMYISGNLEYYVEDNISFRGGLYVFLGASRPTTITVLSKNSSVTFGFKYHFKTKNHLDPFVGFEPGVSWTQLKQPDSLSTAPYPYNISKYPATISPIATVSAGLNYFASKYVHLFIETTYVDGVHVSDIPGVSLSEFRAAFGFGFNFWAIKKK